MDEQDETTIGDVVIKLSSRDVPCFDGSKNQIRWFEDKNGRVWLNAHDMRMGAIGKPNTCGNCIQWRGCAVKDRDKCPGDAMPSKADHSITDEQLKESIDAACKRAYARYQFLKTKNAIVEIVQVGGAEGTSKTLTDQELDEAFKQI